MSWVIKLGAGYIGDRKQISSVPHGYREGRGWGRRVFPFVEFLKDAGRYSKELAEEYAGFLGGKIEEVSDGTSREARF